MSPRKPVTNKKPSGRSTNKARTREQAQAGQQANAAPETPPVTPAPAPKAKAKPKAPAKPKKFVLNPRDTADAAKQPHRRAASDQSKRSDELVQGQAAARTDALGRLLEQRAAVMVHNHTQQINAMKLKFPDNEAVQAVRPMTLAEAKAKIVSQPALPAASGPNPPSNLKPAKGKRLEEGQRATQIRKEGERGVISPVVELPATAAANAKIDENRAKKQANQTNL